MIAHQMMICAGRGVAAVSENATPLDGWHKRIVIDNSIAIVNPSAIVHAKAFTRRLQGVYKAFTRCCIEFLPSLLAISFSEILPARRSSNSTETVPSPSTSFRRVTFFRHNVFSIRRRTSDVVTSSEDAIGHFRQTKGDFREKGEST